MTFEEKIETYSIGLVKREGFKWEAKSTGIWFQDKQGQSLNYRVDIPSGALIGFGETAVEAVDNLLTILGPLYTNLPIRAALIKVEKE